MSDEPMSASQKRRWLSAWDRRYRILNGEGWKAARAANPTDAQIVDLMKQRGNGSREQPRTEMGIPVGLAWRNEAIMEADAQAAWDRHHASEATP